MIVTSREIEIIPNTNNRYATLGTLRDSGQDYVIIMDRISGHCYVESIEEVTGKSGGIKATMPIGGWDTYEAEGRRNVGTPILFNTSDEWNAVITFVIQDSQLVTPERLKAAFSDPEGYTDFGPKIWIPPAFGRP